MENGTENKSILQSIMECIKNFFCTLPGFKKLSVCQIEPELVPELDLNAIYPRKDSEFSALFYEKFRKELKEDLEKLKKQQENTENVEENSTQQNQNVQEPSRLSWKEELTNIYNILADQNKKQTLMEIFSKTYKTIEEVNLNEILREIKMYQNKIHESFKIVNKLWKNKTLKVTLKDSNQISEECLQLDNNLKPLNKCIGSFYKINQELLENIRKDLQDKKITPNKKKNILRIMIKLKNRYESFLQSLINVFQTDQNTLKSTYFYFKHVKPIVHHFDFTTIYPEKEEIKPIEAIKPIEGKKEEGSDSFHFSDIYPETNNNIPIPEDTEDNFVHLSPEDLNNLKLANLYNDEKYVVDNNNVSDSGWKQI